MSRLRRWWAYQVALWRIRWFTFIDRRVRRSATSAADFAWIKKNAGPHAIQLLEAACQRYSDRPCLATREPGGDYHALTYAELWRRVLAAAAALPAEPGDRVGILGFGGPDWVVADLACLYRGAVSVPLPGTIKAEELAHIQAETGMVCVLERLEANAPHVPAPHFPGEGAFFSIVYTSGSTGQPKGVMLTHQRWASTLREALEARPVPRLTVGYLALAHMAGRINVYKTMMSGGLTHFVSNPDMSTLFEDMRLARPTHMVLVPRVSGMIYQHFQTELSRRGGRPGSLEEMLTDPRGRALAREMRSHFLGGRLCFVHTGSAITPPEVARFLERCFGVHLTDLYGSTELGPVTLNGRIYPWLQYKLVDRPGFTRADRPYPRGELAIKSPRATPGYFNNPEATAQLRDEQGYVLTGDLVEERSPRQIVVLERTSNVTRLANGKFLNVSQLEDLFCSQSALIEQAFVYANPLQSYPLAVIVSEFSKSDVRSELQRIYAGLASHEIPRDFLLESRAFSQANGLLSPANKARRGKLKELYGEQLERLYAEIEGRQLGGLAPGQSLTARVCAALALTLGLDSVDPEGPGFVGLGGDSLAAVRLSELLQVPAGTLLDPSLSVAGLIRRMEAPTSRENYAVPKAAPPVPRSILLTGANGFLGRFLALELQERLPRVLCMVRAESDEAARERMLDAYRDPEARQLARRLEVVAGDLTQLPDTLEFDAVLHNGALVNHVLDYEHLEPPNVQGTRAVLRFGKPVHFLSTVGLAGGLGRPLLESDRAADLPHSANGYVESKRVAEMLLPQGSPIYRCGMILPHTRYNAERNESDLFCRLLRGLVQTGLAPQTFGEASYAGLPVDLVARFLAESVATGRTGTYHVTHTNPPLDQLLLWMPPLERMAYPEFFRRFRERLLALPEMERKRSPLPLLSHWERPKRAMKIDTREFDRAFATDWTFDREFFQRCLP